MAKCPPPTDIYSHQHFCIYCFVRLQFVLPKSRQFPSSANRDECQKTAPYSRFKLQRKIWIMEDMRVYIRLFHSAELCLSVTRILQCRCGVQEELKQYIRRRTEHTPWMSSISLGWLKEMKENAGIFTVVIYGLVNV